MDDNQVELHDDEAEIVDEAKVDPDAGTEEQSVASVKKAESAGTAKKRRGDKSNSEPRGKVVAGDPEKHSESTEYDFSDDLNALVDGEATLSEEFKAKTAVIFETAIKSKVSSEVERLEEEYNTRLDEELESIHQELVDKVDGYLNYVVEQWMEANQVAIQQGLRTEIAEEFMGKLKDLFTESYIEVPESKVDLVDDLAEQVAELEDKLNTVTADAIEMAEELKNYVREEIVREHSSDLADTQVEKLQSLVKDLEFVDEESFSSKVKTVKESYFKKQNTSNEIVEESEDNDEVIETSSVMENYLAAIRKQNHSK